MKTIIQIAEELNLKPRTVRFRLANFGIKGKKKIKAHYFTQEEVQKISYKKHKNPKYPLLSNPIFYKKQVQIIEMYLGLDRKNASEISRCLRLPLHFCESSVKYFKQRDFLIVQSKMNYEIFNTDK